MRGSTTGCPSTSGPHNGDRTQGPRLRTQLLGQVRDTCTSAPRKVLNTCHFTATGSPMLGAARARCPGRNASVLVIRDGVREWHEANAWADHGLSALQSCLPDEGPREGTGGWSTARLTRMSMIVRTFVSTARSVNDAIAEVPHDAWGGPGSASGPFGTWSVTPAAPWSRSSTTSPVR